MRCYWILLAIHSITCSRPDYNGLLCNFPGPDSLASLRKLAESYQAAHAARKDDEEDDDEIPELVENFDVSMFFKLKMAWMSHAFHVILPMSKWLDLPFTVIYVLNFPIQSAKIEETD